jgi:GDP-L-fucose synthase
MFHSLMPTNLYGIGDNYHLENSHVLPALIRRFHEAKINNSSTVTAWGTGSASREFLCADDLAEAILTSLSIKDPLDWINVGYGSDVTIKELTEIIARVIGYKGTIIWDKTKPDGTPRKLLDSSEIFKTGWKPKINLEEGVKIAYNDFILCQKQS